MAPVSIEEFDPFLSAPEAEAMVRLCERAAPYGMYVQDSPTSGIGKGLLQRHDAALHYLETGGRTAKPVSLERFAARANTLRKTYAYDRPVVEGIEPLLANESFVEAAKRLYGRPVVQPNIVYANVILPGQELGVHTDVPEFRGANRTREPEWLLVAMHHSGLFERWRIPIATGVSWYHSCGGGEFFYYPDGSDGPEVTLPARHNTAILLDTDSVFHGVGLVGREGEEPADLNPGIELVFDGDERWRVVRDGRTIAHYRWSEIRLSISWKAYCFADEAERRVVAEHSDDLTPERVRRTLVADLRERGRIGDQVPPDEQLAVLVMREYIHFPPAIVRDERGQAAARAGDAA